MFKKERLFIGIEFAEDTLRGVYLTQAKKIYSLVDSFELPIHATEKIREFHRTWPFKKATCTLGVPHAKALMKEYPLDKELQDLEILSYLRAKAQDFFGISLSELYGDYQIISDDKDKLRNVVQVIVIRKKYLQDVLNILSFFRSYFAIVEINTLALGRALHYLSPQVFQENTAVVMIEKNFLLLCVFAKNQLFCTKYEHYPVTWDEDILVSTFKRIIQYYKSLHDQKISCFLLLGEQKHCHVLYQNIELEPHEKWTTLVIDFSTYLLVSYGLAMRGIVRGY